MADPSTSLTWIQVVDSAMKIGLGALISGVATYWVTRSSHSREIEKQAILRKKELIEKISQEFEIFWNSYREYSIESLEYIRRIKTTDDIPSSLFDQLKKTSENVREKINNLSTAQSLMLLLDDEASNKIIEQFAIKTEKYMKDTADPVKVESIKALAGYHNEVLSIRADFYKKLSALYKNPNL